MEVGIATDGRGEVAILAGREPEVAEVALVVAGPRERAQHQAVEEAPVGRVERDGEQRLECAGRLARVSEPGQTEGAEHGVELVELGLPRRFVHAVEHSGRSGCAGCSARRLLAHAAIGEQHVLLDQLVALEPLTPLDPERHAVRVHPRLDLGHVQVE